MIPLVKDTIFLGDWGRSLHFEPDGVLPRSLKMCSVSHLNIQRVPFLILDPLGFMYDETERFCGSVPISLRGIMFPLQ